MGGIAVFGGYFSEDVGFWPKNRGRGVSVRGLGKTGKREKWAFKLSIVVDVIGQYVLNANGGRQNEKERGVYWPRERVRHLIGYGL